MAPYAGEESVPRHGLQNPRTADEGPQGGGEGGGEAAGVDEGTPRRHDLHHLLARRNSVLALWEHSYT